MTVDVLTGNLLLSFVVLLQVWIIRQLFSLARKF